MTGTGGGGKRSRYAAGIEFSIPLTSMLLASVAGRYDKYDDITNVNDARTWGLGLEFRPFNNFLLRGNLSTSFKAPDMHYVFSERSGSFGRITDYYRCYLNNISPDPTVCGGSGGRYSYQVFTTSQGQPSLREETGRSATVGFVWDITDGLSTSLDWYRIDLNDVVSVQSGSSILEAELGCNTGLYPKGEPYPFAIGSEFCNATLPRISRDANGTITEIRSGPINLAYVGTKGLDGTIRYRFHTERFGTFNTSVTWSHVLSQKDRATPASATRDYRDLNSNAGFRSRVRASLTWNKDSWDSTVFMNRLGSFPIWRTSVADAYGYNRRIAPFIVWNISVGKRFNDRFGMRLNVNNVFDRIHPNDPTFNSYPYFWSSYDALGRRVGLEFTYKLN
ncbi:TonB-dependent receptor domain-containing protein [Solilutibacter pythonis]|uniref:TonB-dependent receptor domain-containing protein n=1 Tax=Solilutibacter pythonis TaxID=2483112 RepID=UPI002482AE7E|nr:TonB-dependent receptor [Lysobacter pythonis]